LVGYALYLQGAPAGLSAYSLNLWTFFGGLSLLPVCPRSSLQLRGKISTAFRLSEPCAVRILAKQWAAP
jgi:hypothetical protein